MSTRPRDARALPRSRSPEDAEQDEAAAARATLNEGGVTCRHLVVTIDRSGFGADGVVRANVTCLVEIDDLTGVSVPGHQTVASSFVEPVDRYRGVR